MSSDRKESLLRTLKLQNEQLEQWEEKRTISRDPDEKKLCNIKIADIKELIEESEKELRKLGGGKQEQTYEDAGKPNVTYLEHNEIGFNADKKFSDNTVVDPFYDNNALNKLGDEVDPGKTEIGESGALAILQSKGNSGSNTNKKNKQKPETAVHASIEDKVHKKKKVSATNKIFLLQKDNLSLNGAALLTILILIFSFVPHKSDIVLNPFFGSTLVKVILFCASMGGILCIYIFAKINQGLKFALSILILCVSAACMFWKFGIVGETGSITEKSFGEVVILPLLIITIGSILLLINEEYKPKENKTKQ